MEKYEIIMEAFIAMYDGCCDEGREIIEKNWAFDPAARPRFVGNNKVSVVSETEAKQSWQVDPALKMKVFDRDGFVNRFTGEPLVLTAALRLLSHELGGIFPFHQNWKAEQTHMAYYELGTCANKLLPPTRGGREELNNLVTTTMPYVLARSNATVEESGLTLFQGGDLKEWDGLSRLFVDLVRDRLELKKLSFVRTWYPAAVKAAEGRD